MPSQTEQIAASQQRQQIPRSWVLEFDGWSDEALDSLGQDSGVHAHVRAYAHWELDYRRAFGLQMVFE